MRLAVGLAVFALAIAVMFRDWSGSKAGVINVIGSTSVMPFAEMLAQEFNGRAPAYEAHVQGGGSTVGVQATLDGIADVGMCSRSLKPDEAQTLNPIAIAHDGLAIVVHPTNPVDNLTRTQVRQMFAGEITNWKEVGGPDMPIRLIVREESSGTREAFMTLIMGKSRVSRKAINQDSNGAIKEIVKDDPNAIGFMSLGLVTGELKSLKIDGVVPSHDNVMNKTYPLVRPFLFITKGPPTDRAKPFIEYVLSPHAQEILEKEGLVRVR